MKTKANFLNIEMVIGDAKTFNFETIKSDLCGILVQSPDNNGYY